MSLKSYVTLFSGAGIGCYGFHLEGFECVATNEILDSRMDIQKINEKCKNDEGYIYGDITQNNIKKSLLQVVERWKGKNKADIDVVIATPPCQGMSTANYKKNHKEIIRNSLVVEAVNLVQEIEPKIFIFENVRAFYKTICTDIDKKDIPIGEMIELRLGRKYNIHHQIINFKDYGVPSSRPRSLVIGTKKELINLSPILAFPENEKQITLEDSIGDLKSLGKMGEIDNQNIYHFFREYPEYMRKWITNLKEKESAFSNPDNTKPYKIVNGKKQLLKSGHLGNKFRRLSWNTHGSCITTRNDQLASQDTIHPADDRVLSIAELMRLMTIPEDFKWTSKDISELNKLNYTEKRRFLRTNELNIRRTIGEAVPTKIMQKIACNINKMLDFEEFLNGNSELDNIFIRMYKYEISHIQQKTHGVFYTPQSVVFQTIKNIDVDSFGKKGRINILEPTVGVGNFLVQLNKFFALKKEIVYHLCDIDSSALNFIRSNLEELCFQSSTEITYINQDIITADLLDSYDLVIGNPPYFTIDAKRIKEYTNILGVESKSKNIFTYIMDKIRFLSKQIVLVIPKSFLMAPQYNLTKARYQGLNIVNITDYGVRHFKKVFIEIISIHFQEDYKNKIVVEDVVNMDRHFHQQGSIYYNNLWLIYRDNEFDSYLSRLKLDVFHFYRDRQLTNKYMTKSGKYWVIRSKNINDDGTISHIEGYDRYIDNLDEFILKKYLNKEYQIITNFTYNLRASTLPKNAICNGSIVILIPKKNQDEIYDLSYYSSMEYRRYYEILKNKSRFTINIDSNTIYYLGVLK